MNMYEKYFKRLLDILLSGGALIILSPVLLIVALLVRIKLGSPVLFKQERPGLNERIFMLYKFRTMTDEKDEHGKLLPNNQRSTKLGNILRKTSIDELPSLINILKGDMSIVGPRPLIVEYLPYYTDRERTRHNVRPGLTGLAQVNGRNFLKWEERFAFDLDYIENMSFYLDLKICINTIIKFLKNNEVAEVAEVKTDEIGDYILYENHKYRLLNVERSKNSAK